MVLQAGDCVALIAPASGQKVGQECLVQHAIHVLSSWGLKIVQVPQFGESRYLAASDPVRAMSLKMALTEPDVKAIFVTRGGYGCARLLPYLLDVQIPSLRCLVGFSDVTTLHLRFQNVANLHCLHAPNIATEYFLADDELAQANRLALHDYLFFGKKDNIVESLQWLCGEHYADVTLDLTTPMTGGCLSLLITSLGTAHEIQTDGKIVMIEDVGEGPYKIDRMLTHLKNAGKFDKARAVIFGSLTHCSSPNIDVKDVICDVLGNIECPVYHSPTFGHDKVNLPWKYD